MMTTQLKHIAAISDYYQVGVFFGLFVVLRGYLPLAKEYQSRSYDALVAHTTIVFARYILLELTRRSTKDPRTQGSLFHAGCDELRQTSFHLAGDCIAAAE